ncbi:MAG: recombinase family protein [Proteobacteria bacterium]|nr:recombinase family protein [Pseudomonadota bacterium]
MISSAKMSPYRVGLYVRVSTEEQAQNPEGSIKSQEQRLRQYIEFKNLEGNFGSAAELFVDRAKSGKDTKRPQLQRMLQCIRKKEIDLVMVCELSRLSRSIRDFTDIWELMKAHGCGFLSLREQFDTTTAAGEMVLYTIANISQFERKQVSERVSANFLARAKRGLFNGGSVPYGYEMNPDNKAQLLINEEDAEVIRACFDSYLEYGGLADAAKSLNDRGYRFAKSRMGGGHRARLGHFTIDNLQGVLRNQSYKGVRIYVENGENKSTKACWPAIIESEKFDRVQRIMTKNYEGRVKLTYPNRYPYMLSTLVVCGQCGDRLPGKSAHGGSGVKVPYYEHGTAAKKQACLTRKIFNCAPTRFPARIAEPLIWQEIEKLLRSESLATQIIAQAHDVHKNSARVTDCDKLRSKVRGVEDQLTSLAEHLSKIPKTVSPTPIYTQMEHLGRVRGDLQRELEKLQASGDFIDRPASLKDYRSYLKVLCTILHGIALPEEKSALVKALVHRIEVFPNLLKLHFLVSETPIQLALDFFSKKIERKKLREVTNNTAQKIETLDHKKILVQSSKKELKSGSTPT